MILIINTADKEQVFIGLVDKNEIIIFKKFKAKYQQAEKLLVKIDELLKVKSLKLKDLKAVGVVSGPGPFTALRIGIATANTLGFALKIPVIELKSSDFDNVDNLAKIIKNKNKKVGKIVKPQYGKEPNITKAKK